MSAPKAPPALLTSTCSTGPTRSASAATDARSVTSHAVATPPISSASVSIRSVRRAAQCTRKPSAARRRAVAAPMPLLAPVTRAIRRLLGAGTMVRLCRAASDGRLAGRVGPSEDGRSGSTGSRPPDARRSGHRSSRRPGLGGRRLPLGRRRRPRRARPVLGRGGADHAVPPRARHAAGQARPARAAAVRGLRAAAAVLDGRRLRRLVGRRRRDRLGHRRGRGGGVRGRPAGAADARSAPRSETPRATTRRESDRRTPRLGSLEESADRKACTWGHWIASR